MLGFTHNPYQRSDKATSKDRTSVTVCSLCKPLFQITKARCQRRSERSGGRKFRFVFLRDSWHSLMHNLACEFVAADIAKPNQLHKTQTHNMLSTRQGVSCVRPTRDIISSCHSSCVTLTQRRHAAPIQAPVYRSVCLRRTGTIMQSMSIRPPSSAAEETPNQLPSGKYLGHTILNLVLCC